MPLCANTHLYFAVSGRLGRISTPTPTSKSSSVIGTSLLFFPPLCAYYSCATTRTALQCVPLVVLEDAAANRGFGTLPQCRLLGSWWYESFRNGRWPNLSQQWRSASSWLGLSKAAIPIVFVSTAPRSQTQLSMGAMEKCCGEKHAGF